MYEDVTYEIILQRMLDRVSDKLDKREGSVIWDTHSPTAIEFQILYLELDTILREAYGDTASRDFLIMRCKERGIQPHEATQAILKGVFTPVTLEIPLGSRFNLSEMNFIVINKIKNGEYQLKCESAGIIGNQNLGTIVPIDYILGLEQAELTEILIPGEDEEDTEELRKRYFSSFNSQAFGGNKKDYLEKTNAIPGVGSTKVTAVWNSDINPLLMIPNSSVKQWYEEIKESLSMDVKVWLSSVYTAGVDKKLTTGGTVLLTILDANFNPANDVLIATVQEIIDPQETSGEGMGSAPIGHVVSVKTADAITLYVKTDITFEAGYGWSNLLDVIKNSVDDYFIELRKTWADNKQLIVRISQIETRLITIDGILDVANTTINGSENNFVLNEMEVPILGEVSG